MADLIKKFNDKVRAKANSRPFDPSVFKIKPSMLGSKCLRKAFYACTEVPEDYPMSMEVKRICKMGDAVGEMLTKEFRELGVLIDYYSPDKEKPAFSKEFPISDPDLFIKRGFIDGVFVIDGKLWLGEFKSINSNNYKGLTKPKTEHYYQGITYLYTFNNLLAKGEYSHIKELAGFKRAEGIIFLYVNKDNSYMKQFVVTGDAQFFESLVQRIYFLRESYEQKTLPPKTEDWCKSCSWRDKCAANKLS